MNNNLLWNTKDVLKITTIIAVSFGTFLVGTFLFKKLFGLQDPVISLIINSGLALSIISTYFIYTKKKGMNLLKLGFKKIKTRWLFLSILIGLLVVFVGGGLSTLLSRLLSLDVSSSLVSQDALSSNLLLNLLNFKLLIGILVPISEELYFRGLLFKYFRGKYSFLYAGLISTLIFSMVHFSPEMLLFTFTLGFTSAFLFEKTQSILPSFMIHIAANTMAVNLLLMGVYFN